MGPKIEPCGTPCTFLSELEICPLNLTHWVRFVRYDIISLVLEG